MNESRAGIAGCFFIIGAHLTAAAILDLSWPLLTAGLGIAPLAGVVTYATVRTRTAARGCRAQHGNDLVTGARHAPVTRARHAAVTPALTCNPTPSPLPVTPAPVTATDREEVLMFAFSLMAVFAVAVYIGYRAAR